jgi:hypothetical protein
MGKVITDEGRVDVKILARQIDVTVPTIAKLLGKSPKFLNSHPTAPSFQPRALQIVDRVNELAHALGGVPFAIAFLKTPTKELGEKSPLDLLKTDENGFQAGLNYIDSFLMMDPD